MPLIFPLFGKTFSVETEKGKWFLAVRYKKTVEPKNFFAINVQREHHELTTTNLTRAMFLLSWKSKEALTAVHRVFKIHPQGNLNMSTKFYGNPSNSKNVSGGGAR